MALKFDDDRHYVLGDPALEVIATRERLAQWRYQRRGPDYYKIGRKVIYLGADLNDWLQRNRSNHNQ